MPRHEKRVPPVRTCAVAGGGEENLGGQGAVDGGEVRSGSRRHVGGVRGGREADNARGKLPIVTVYVHVPCNTAHTAFSLIYLAFRKVFMIVTISFLLIKYYLNDLNFI